MECGANGEGDVGKVYLVELTTEGQQYRELQKGRRFFSDTTEKNGQIQETLREK